MASFLATSGDAGADALQRPLPSLGVCAGGGEPGEDYRSEPGAAVPCGRGPLYRKRPEPSDFDGWGGVGLDEIDVIFLCAWLAAPVELRGSRPELGAIDDDDDVRQTQMTTWCAWG